MLPSILILITLFLTSLSCSTLAAPVGASSSTPFTEEGGKILAEAFDKLKLARKPADDAYARLETFQKKPVPTTSTLRPPNDEELDDIRGTTSFVRTDETDALGFIHPSHPYIGRTDRGRLVFDYPKYHSMTLYVPDKSHALTEQLIAINHGGDRGKLYHYGYTTHLSTGTHEVYKDIAIKLPDGRYLVKDDVPVNRLLYNYMLSDDWFKHLVAHGDSNPAERHSVDIEKGKLKLGDSVEGKVIFGGPVEGKVWDTSDPSHVEPKTKEQVQAALARSSQG